LHYIFVDTVGFLYCCDMALARSSFCFWNIQQIEFT
jgi:hypothetical protein